MPDELTATLPALLAGSVPVLLLLALCYAMARQLGHPRGWVGRRLMARALNGANKGLLDAAVEALEARKGDRIVDVGFGGGYALDRIRERVAPARPAGVEISLAMIEAGRERWGDAVDLHRTDVARMPFADGSQDGVLSVNTLYFWPEPHVALREIRRVLTPGGRLVLGVRSRGMMRLSPVTWFGFRLYSIRQLEDLLSAASFAVEIREKVKGELLVLGRAI